MKNWKERGYENFAEYLGDKNRPYHERVDALLEKLPAFGKNNNIVAALEREGKVDGRSRAVFPIVVTLASSIDDRVKRLVDAYGAIVVKEDNYIKEGQ